MQRENHYVVVNSPISFRCLLDHSALHVTKFLTLSWLCPTPYPRLASRILRFFVRHVALVRPLSEAGKLRLARDMGELEFAVGQHLMPVQALGEAYRALRALRPLLFAETEAVPSSSFLQVSEVAFQVNTHFDMTAPLDIMVCPDPAGSPP